MATLSPENAICALLTADADYNGLVAGRYYSRVNVPQNPTEPFLTHFRVDANREPHMLNASGSIRARIQVEHWATGYDEARLMGEYSRLALDNYAGTVTSGADSLAVSVIYLDDDSDVFDFDQPGREAYVPGFRQDFIVWFTESIPSN